MRTIVLLAGLMCVSTVAAQQVPSNAMAQALEAVDVINAGDSARAATFIKRRLSPAALTRRAAGEYVHLLLEIGRQSNGVTVRSAEDFAGGVALKLWARNGDRGLMFAVAPDRTDTARIGRMDALRFFHPAADVRVLPPLASGKNAFVAALDAELRRLATAGEFAGTVVISRRGSVVYQAALGDAVRDGERNSADTRYHLASVGKMFAAVAIARLVEAGRLSLDDSVGALVPLLPWAAGSRGITIRQLLSHTSGLGQSETAGRPVDATFAGTPPAFPPGTRFSYSNDGYEILGMVIERISGRAYQDFVRDEVLARAGMTDTDAYPVDSPLAHRATGYGHQDGDLFGSQPPVPNTDKVKGHGTAAGGQYGTARDLARFGHALVGGRLIDRAMLDTLTAPRSRLPGPHPDEWYGYGFVTYTSNGLRVLGHAGGGAGWGICSRLDVVRELDYSVAVLSNVDPPECEEVSRAVVEAITAERER